MKTRHLVVLAVCLLFVVLASRASAVQAALSPTAHYALTRWTVDGGGGLSSGGGYALHGTAGQPEAGRLSGQGYTLSGGFWGGTQGKQTWPLYLPLILQNAR